MSSPIAADWVALGGFAQIAAAVATVALAAITWRLATSTRDLSRDTKDLATEAETDRRLAWRPQLSVMFPGLGLTLTGDPADMELRVLNAGGGPALNCKVIARWPGGVTHWADWAVGDLMPTSSTDVVKATFRPGDTPDGAFSHVGPPPDPAPDVAVFCSDILNRRWRFLVKMIHGSGGHWSIGPPATWTIYSGEEAPPGGSAQQRWSVDPHLFGPD